MRNINATNCIYLVGCVVYDKIEEKPHSSGVALSDQTLHVRDCAVRWIDIAIVRNIVSHIDLRRIVHGTYPDNVNADRLDVIQF